MANGDDLSMNGSGTKLVWYIIGLFGVTLVGIVSFIISGISAINTRITTFEVQAATRTEKVRVLEAEAELVKREMGEIRTKIQENSIKNSQFESTLKLAESRLNTMSERLMTINNRLDGIKQKQEFQDGK